MTLVANEITAMQSQTAQYQLAQEQNLTSRTGNSKNDSNMFLTLMLQQLQNQDPTEPTSNTEWLSQLAQYSSLEQMTQMNQGLSNCMNFMSSMYNDMSANSEITQTLSLIGKEVTIADPDDPSGKARISGTVSEASFEDGMGKVKVNDRYYSIANVLFVKDGVKQTETNQVNPS